MKSKTRKPRTSRSLTATLAFAFLALSAIILLIFGGLQTFSNVLTQREVIASKLKLSAQDASLQVSNFIQGKFNTLKAAATLTNLMKATPDQQQLVLDGLLGSDDAFRQVSAINTQDQEVASASRSSKLVAHNLADRLSADARAQIKQGQQYISSVYVDPETSELMTSIAIPATDALGDFQGILAAEVNLKFMKELVERLKVGESGLAYVTDKQGNLIAFKDDARVLKGDNVAHLAEVAEFVSGHGTADELAGKLSVGIKEDTVAGTYAALGTPDWAVFVEEPWAEAYREVILNGFASGVILVILVVLAGLLGVYVARRLSVPLVSLTSTASEISAGKLELQAQVGGPAEVAQLATSFNSMTTQLRSLISSLEERVEARTSQLRASAEVGRTVTSILEPNQLLKQVAELITARFGFYYVGVFVLGEENRWAVLRAATGEAGRTLLERQHRLPINEESMVGAAIVTRSAHIALDVGEGAVRFANPLLPNTRSEIALPLRVGDRALGALDVQSEQPGVFDEASADVLQTMADQIAVALFNAESFRRSEWQTNTMAWLNQLSRSLATATSLEDIALTVLPIMTNLFGQLRLAIVQKTANSQILSLREFSTDPDRPVGDSQVIQAADSLIGECVQQGEVINTSDLGQVADKYSDAAWFHSLGMHSGVILPLRVGERILGTLSVGANQIEAFSAEQITQMEQIASQVAITVENLNLAEQTQQTLAELDAANRQLIGQAWEQYTRTARLTAAEWHAGHWTVSSDRTARPETSRAVVPAPQALSVPIKVRGATIGEFNITATEANPAWDADEQTFAQALIDQVGQVLENARLIDETERLAQREKAVADAADKIHRSTDLESVLNSAIVELRRITGRNGISVQVGFGHADPASQRSRNADTEGDR